MNTIDRVNRILKDQLVLSDEIKPTDVLADDLGADSLDMIEIGLALEEEFEIEIPDEDYFQKPCTVSKIYEYIAGRVKA